MQLAVTSVRDAKVRGGLRRAVQPAPGPAACRQNRCWRRVMTADIGVTTLIWPPASPWKSVALTTLIAPHTIVVDVGVCLLFASPASVT
jgi:hypothetical protein